MMRLLVHVFSVMLVLESYTITCCLQNERDGLLEIKTYLRSIDKDNSNSLLSSWTTGDCCEWEKVTCSLSSGHVIHLSLNSIVQPVQGWILNMTVFHPFQELTLLDFSNNTIRSITHTPGVGILKKLEELDLSYIDQLDQLPNFFWNLTSLRILDLTMSFVGGELDARVCELINIREVYFYYSLLNGSFPDCVWNLTSLRILELTGNSFTGKFPSQVRMPFLEWLSIYDNNFQGEFSLSSLTNHSTLKHLDLSYNNIQVRIEESSTPPKTQIQYLGLGNCNLNVHTNTLRRFLSFQSNMQYLDITSNGLVGSFPSWLLQNNSNLQLLYLWDNSLTGGLNLPLHSHPSLSYLIISENQFDGEIPHDMGTKLSALRLLAMTDNSFQGQIPESFGNMTQLEFLNLANNNLSGKVPKKIYSDCSNLLYLMLSNNSLNGEIIPSNMNWPSIVVLSLDQNRFQGTIKESLKISIKLRFLDLSYNEASGELPRWIGSLSGQIYAISMAGNQLIGSIPSQICRLSRLAYLDLSENRLTGEIPSCGCPSYLSHMHLRGNNLTGSIPKGLQSCSRSLRVLDLGSNRLSGGVPRWINMLPILEILALKDNHIQGKMPIELCQLQHLNIFDVSNNSITGVIPSCLRNSSFGVVQGEKSFDADGDGITLQTGFKLRGRYISMTFQTMDLVYEEEDFTVKSRYATYIDNNIYIMSVLDLSSNQLSGYIPPEIGDLRKLNTLNLSHNHLFGPIPKSFSKLTSIESLDLSWNNLSGIIPSQLVDLNFLEIFNVSYNNLSGRVPETGQFANFDEDNYRGNPLLYGPQLSGVEETPSSSPTDQGDEGDTADHEFDFQVFFWSFGSSFIIVLLTFFAVLYINPAWRRAWSAFLDYHLLWWL